MRISLITLLFACLFFNASAQLATAKLFGNHMVLQRNQRIPVWGWAEKNKKVTVAINGQTVIGKADGRGKWSVTLQPMKEGGPYQMKIKSGKEQLTYTDVMLGEVWICSGQSNMEFQLKNAYGFKQELKNAPEMPIRQFHVPDKISLTPEKDLSGGQWDKADTNTVGDFTAVGYFFAKNLAKTLHVTVGLISSNWGGTQVEDWISREAMLKSPELSAVTKTLPDNYDGLKERIDHQMKDYVYNGKPVVNFTVDELAAEPASFFAQWQSSYAPSSWEWIGKLYSYSGEGFMQHTIKLDSSYSKSKSIIRLGTTDADIDLYINGKLIKQGAVTPDYKVDLPVGTWKRGDNSVLVQLLSKQTNPAWFGMGLNGDSNDINVKFADTTVNLADVNWKVMPDLSKPYHFDYLPNNSANMLFNSMINPLMPYAIAGVIWYQGESNADRAFQYKTSFPLMITDWRNGWKENFPFLFVQISSFGGFQNSNIGSSWAELREAQSLALQLPNTGMAVTTDIGDAFNIHPKDKADVGLRLANKALTTVYHLSGFAESPLFAGVVFIGNAALVSFNHAENGLIAKDKYMYIRGFEVAGADHKFYYAQAEITDGNKVKAWSNQVAQPIAVRYAWTDAPIDANLFNMEGFPVSSFRTDNWKEITEGKKFE